MAEYGTKEELYAVIDRMINALQSSESLRARIGQSSTSVRFRVTDLDAQFSFQFAKGAFSGAIDSADPCDVGVSLSSKVLDGIFSGKQDPESAYTYGLLSLQGREYVAEGLLRFWRDMTAAYQAATTN